MSLYFGRDDLGRLSCFFAFCSLRLHGGCFTACGSIQHDPPYDVMTTCNNNIRWRTHVWESAYRWLSVVGMKKSRGAGGLSAKAAIRSPGRRQQAAKSFIRCILHNRPIFSMVAGASSPACMSSAQASGAIPERIGSHRL